MKIVLIESYCDLTEYSHVEVAFKVPKDMDVHEEYKRFCLNKAKQIGIEINDHWLNVMNNDIGINESLTEEEYKQKKKEYKKFRKKNRMIKFLKENLKLEEVEFEVKHII